MKSWRFYREYGQGELDNLKSALGILCTNTKDLDFKDCEKNKDHDSFLLHFTLQKYRSFDFIVKIMKVWPNTKVC